MLCKWGAERVGGATRQWLFNLCEWGQRQQRRQREAVEIQAAVDATKMAAAAVEEEAMIIERAAKAIRLYGYDQMNTVAYRQNSKWCSVVWSLCELLGI